uniref:BTB domain-containing protein n=1 Tax=Trichuris muris TaxID=70415 RepID=A0A5S6QMI7_TRIMR
MFTLDMMEKTAAEITIQDIGFDILQDVINFVYTGKILLTLQSAPNILMASAYLQLDSLVNACNSFLIERMSHYNIEDLIVLGKYSNCVQLVNLAWNFMLKFFLQYSKQNSFLQTSHKNLVELLKDDKLVVCTEMDVFQSIKRWVGADVTNRGNFLPSLLTCVRLHLLPKQCVSSEILADELVQRFAGDFKLIDFDSDADGMLDLRRQIIGINVGEIEAHPRNWDLVTKQVYLSGNSVSQHAIRLHRFDYSCESWSKVIPLNIERYKFEVAGLPNKLFFIGGIGRVAYIRDVNVYDVRNHSYTTATPLLLHRTLLSTAVCGQCIYVIGGQYGIELLDSVEVFYAQENRWIFSKELPEVRVSCASVYLNGRVYVIGGSNGTCITRTVYCFDINSGQWSKLANIKEPRRYLGAAVLNEKIYVVGGSNHAGPLCSAECYDLRQDMWTPVANMNVRRSMLGVVEYDGCLFAFGGFDVHDPLCTSEVYNPKQNEWQFLSASNGIQGSCTAATVPIINTL